MLRTPKGWTGPKTVNGLPVEGTFRSHQVPLANVRTDPTQLAALDTWLRSYHPDRLFDERGKLLAELGLLAPSGPRRICANPRANGGALSHNLDLLPFESYAIEVPQPGVARAESTRPFGAMLRDVYVRNPTSFRLFCPDETNSNRLGAVFEVESRCFQEPTIAIDDHVREAQGLHRRALRRHAGDPRLDVGRELILAVNCGSSSLKYAMFDDEVVVVRGVIERVGSSEVPDHTAAVGAMFAALAQGGIRVRVRSVIASFTAVPRVCSRRSSTMRCSQPSNKCKRSRHSALRRARAPHIRQRRIDAD